MNNEAIDRMARRYTRMFTLLALIVVAGCSGSDTPPAAQTEPGNTATVDCDPADAASHAACGSVLVALTDADGDFLNYTVDVVSLQLETANGRQVETLPQRTRINFSDYVDLTELVSVAIVPPATYVAGTISLDYSDAEIFVEADGAAKEAVVTDESGNTLSQTDLKITLANREQLTVVRGRTALLQLDFDLDASHSVDIETTPALAATGQFIVAEVEPMDEKDLRVRGPLLRVDENEMRYVAAVRPFHDRDGDFGQAEVLIDAGTVFEVDGIEYQGSEGLQALAAAGERTPTLAQGTLNVSERQFTARSVFAGSSVPGSEQDAVKGSVVAREGNTLTIHGATVIATTRRPHFHDNVTVEVGPNTTVTRQGSAGAELGVDAVSIGQKVEVRGVIVERETDAESPVIHIDASEGAVRLKVTHLAGLVSTVVAGQTDIALHSIDRRRAGRFDFSGTGGSPDGDADPDNYEVATGDLPLAALAEGKPVVAYGFPTAFGTAPHDFDGRTLIDYTDVRSALGIGWRPDGTVTPFLRLDAEGLVLDNFNTAIDRRHAIKTGPVTVDLTALDSGTTIVPTDAERRLYFIKSGDSLQQYTEFTEFANELSLSLDGNTAARTLHARGSFDPALNVFTAYKIGVELLTP